MHPDAVLLQPRLAAAVPTAAWMLWPPIHSRHTEASAVVRTDRRSNLRTLQVQSPQQGPGHALAFLPLGTIGSAIDSVLERANGDSRARTHACTHTCAHMMCAHTHDVRAHTCAYAGAAQLRVRLGVPHRAHHRSRRSCRLTIRRLRPRRTRSHTEDTLAVSCVCC